MIDSSDNRSIRIFAASIATLIALVALYFAVVLYLWSRDTTPRGILANFNDWPEPVQQLKLNMDDGKQTHPSFQVFLLYGQPAQILSTVICKIDYSDDTFQTVKSFLTLSPVKPTDAIQVQRQVVPPTLMAGGQAMPAMLNTSLAKTRSMATKDHCIWLPSIAN